MANKGTETSSTTEIGGKALTREIGRIVIAALLLVFAGFLFYFAFTMPEPAAAAGAGTLGGTIVGAQLTYWLKPG